MVVPSVGTGSPTTPPLARTLPSHGGIQTSIGDAEASLPRAWSGVIPINPGPSWNKLSPSSAPSPRTDAAIAYDPNSGDCGAGATSGCVVLFGGCGTTCPEGDTWVFYSSNWHSICTSSCGPTPVYGAGMAYDVADGYVLLSGGDTGSSHPQQTWKFSGGTWTQLSPTQNSGTDSNQLAVYDPNSADCGSGATEGCVVMFGGWNGASQDYGTWVWQGNNDKWVQPTASGPSGRADMGGAYDSSDRYVLMFGGAGGGGVDGDTWEYKNNVWTQIPIGGVDCGDSGQSQPACTGNTPGYRVNTWMTFDGADGYPLLFGGCSTVNCGGGGNTYYSDTWKFSAGVWSNPCTSCGSITGRALSPMVYDSANGSVVLFGGTNGGTLGETWAYGPPPTVASFSCSPTTLDSGGSVTCTTAASGGIAPLAYSYSGAGCAAGTASTYTCQPGVGSYTPTVTVTDAVGRTATGSSSYTVVADPSVTATASPAVTDTGVQVSFGSTPIGGQSGYTYSWKFGDAGTSAVQNPTHAYANPGNYSACVNVTDSAGVTSASPGCARVTVNTPPAISTFVASPSSITLGAGATFTVSAYHGTGPLGFAYAGLPTGCASANTPSLSCTPTSASGSPFMVHVYVNDSQGRTAQANASLTVSPGGTTTLASVTATPGSASLGYSSPQSFTATAYDTSGNVIRAGVTFTWALTPGSLGSLNAYTGATVTFTSASSAGTGTLTVTASYGANSKAFSVTITVSANPAPLSISSFTAAPSTVAVGAPSTLRVTAAGGYGSLSYAYSGLPNGCSPPSASSSSFTCTPTATGTYNVSVTVSDQAGHSATAWTTLTVSAGTAVQANDWTPYYVGAILAILVGFVLLLLLMRRRRPSREGAKRPDPAPDPSGSWASAQTEPPPFAPLPEAASPGPPPAYYSGVTFAQPPQEWSRDPSLAYGTYEPQPPPAPAASEGFPSSALRPDSYRPWALTITPDGIDVEEVGKGPERSGTVADAEFTSVGEASPAHEPEIVQRTPSPADAYVILYGLAQRPRSLDALKQMVRLTDDAVTMLVQTLEKARLVAHGTKGSTRTVIYAITPIGRQLTRRALTEAVQEVGTPAALPAPSREFSEPNPSPTMPEDAEFKVPSSTPQRPPVKVVDVGGFTPQDVNPKAQSIPEGAYQAWSADVLGGTANVHEIGGKGAEREAAERERIRKLLDNWRRQKRAGMR